MRSAYLQRSSDLSPAAMRRRTVSIVLTVAAHLLLVWLLLRLAPAPSEPPKAERQTTFELLPDAGETPQPVRRQVQKAERRAARAASAAPSPPALPKPPVPVPAPSPAPAEWNYLREDFDLAKVPRRAREADNSATGAANGSEDDGAAGDAVAVAGPGDGPGGQRLYNADWYREPTDAELSFYLRRGAPAGAWAMIACRTAEKYHVEDCRALGESPAGSGLANSIRQAAWQFLVIPPRIGGRRLVGSWVRIRISWTDKGAAAS